MIHVEITRMVGKHPLRLELYDRLLDCFYQLEVRNRVQLDVPEAVASGIGDTHHARAIGGQLMQPRELGARVARIGVAAQHAGYDAMRMVRE